MIYTYLNNIYALFNEISPFLILGFFISGVLSILLTVEFISKYLGGKSYSSIFTAAVLGIPLPLCSCGVIPVTAFLRKHGASKGASTSFLISTPQTGVDSIMVTYSLLGPLLAIYRPIIALISGLLGGGLVHLTDRDKSQSIQTSCDDDCCDEYESSSKVVKVLHYGFVRLPLDIVSPLIFGILLSALIAIVIPENYFMDYGEGIIGMLFMLILSLPTYICATASVPLAFVFYTKGFSLGAILVFLMAGPATNITTIAVTLKILGRKSTAIYLFSIILSAFVAGYLLDLFSPQLNLFASDYHVHMSDSLLTYLCSAMLLGIVLNSLRIKYFPSKVALHDVSNSLEISVGGMTCSHCVDSVKKSLLKLENINDVSVNLDKGLVNIVGENLDVAIIESEITELGFKIKK